MKTIPAMPTPILPAKSLAPQIKLPPVIILTKDEVEYLSGACDDYASLGQVDAYTQEELTKKYPGITRSNACDWAIYGFTVQDRLTVESHMAEIASYVQQLRDYIDFIEKLMIARRKIAEQQINQLQQEN